MKEASQSAEVPRIMFVYWGRRGALTRFALELGYTIVADENIGASISVSRQNVDFDAYRNLGAALFPVDTFARNIGAVIQSWRIPILRRRFLARLQQNHTHAVVDLMPHVWSPLVAPAVQHAGISYVAIAHDADAHPGDATAVVKRTSDYTLRRADHVITLSHTVADRLVEIGWVPPDKISVLFLPDLRHGASRDQRSERNPGDPIRLLFLGRIMRYKGLSLFLDLVEHLRANGIAVAPGVFGEGSLGSNDARLARMDIEIVNRWLSDQEVGDVLRSYDALVVSHIEASQSGVVAAAFGASLPVIATPVGGLVEQVIEGKTGVVAAAANAPSLAEAVQRLFFTPGLFQQLCHNIKSTRNERSMDRFVRECISTVGGMSRSMLKN